MATYYGFPGFIESDGEFTSCLVGYPLNKPKTELVFSSPVYAVAVAGNRRTPVNFSVAGSSDLFPKMCAQRRMEKRPVTIFFGPGLIRTAGTLNDWMERVNAAPGAFANLLDSLPTFKFKAGKDGCGSLDIERGFDEKKFAEVDRVAPFSIVPKNLMSSITLLSPDSFPLVKFERSHVRMPEISDEDLENLCRKRRRTQ